MRPAPRPEIVHQHKNQERVENTKEHQIARKHNGNGQRLNAGPISATVARIISRLCAAASIRAYNAHETKMANVNN